MSSLTVSDAVSEPNGGAQMKTQTWSTKTPCRVSDYSLFARSCIFQYFLAFGSLYIFGGVQGGFCVRTRVGLND